MQHEMIKHCGSYPHRNGLAVAQRELVCIERTLFFIGAAAP
jgi:hypothetical protein